MKCNGYIVFFGMLVCIMLILSMPIILFMGGVIWAYICAILSLNLINILNFTFFKHLIISCAILSWFYLV